MNAGFDCPHGARQGKRADGDAGRLFVKPCNDAIRFLYAAGAARRGRRRDVAQGRRRRARPVLDELKHSLDTGQHQIARNPHDLYNFCSQHLIGSTANSDSSGYEEVAELLGELNEAWDQSSMALSRAGAA